MKNENVEPKELPNNYKELYNAFCDDVECGLQIDDGRFMAYDKCKNAFARYCKNELNDEIMALHLYAFLSSWGMTTYTQYLTKKNYTCLINVAQVLKDNYSEWSKFSHDFCPDKHNVGEEKMYIDTVLEMRTKIIKALNKGGSEALPKDATDVLINKIIMVTYGCVPAFDSYIQDEWGKLGYYKFNGNGKDWLNSSLLKELYEYVDHNRQELLALPSENHYSVFKKLDMILWEKNKLKN